MYLPNLMPRDVHHLWLSTDNKPPYNRSFNNINNTNNNNNNNNSINSYPPPLSSYSSERPGPSLADDDTLHDGGEHQKDIRLRQLNAIRTLGYSYLVPLGVGKTMQTLTEEREMRRQLEEQMFQSETTGTGTVENLMGEANNNVDDGEGEGEGDEDNHQVELGVEVIQEEAPLVINNQEEEDEEEEVVQQQQRDLDNEIPEAEEADYEYEYEYDDEVDDLLANDATNNLEQQYDRGFMITEQYESHEDAHELGTHASSPVQFNTPPAQVHYNHQLQQQNRQPLAHSGSMGSMGSLLNNSTTLDSTLGDLPHNEANVSMNASDLDMTIDE